MTRSAMNLERVDWGLDTDLLTVRLALAQDSYPGPESRIAFHDQLAAQLRAVPGVQDVAIASNFPSRGGFTVAAEIEDLPLTEGHAPQSVTQVIVGTGYFDLARVDPQRGRFFTNSDGRAGERVVVIEQRFADRFWPGEDALGKRLRWDGGDDVEWMRVVGIAPRILHSLPMDFLPDQPVIYTPYRAEPLRNMGLMVRSDADLETLTASLRETVRAIDAELPLFSIVPLRSLLKEATFGWRFTSALFATLGLIALFLSCLGLYAVMAFAITRRQQEIGVRMALGARAQQVVKLVLRAAMLQAGAGLVIGILGALAATRLLRMFMFEVSTADPLAFGLAVGLLLLTALVASWLPALRASRVDPLEALRTD